MGGGGAAAILHGLMWIQTMPLAPARLLTHNFFSFSPTRTHILYPGRASFNFSAGGGGAEQHNSGGAGSMGSEGDEGEGNGADEVEDGDEGEGNGDELEGNGAAEGDEREGKGVACEGQGVS